MSGVPVVIGAGGVERIVEIKLDAAEQAAFDKSCDERAGVDRCEPEACWLRLRYAFGATLGRGVAPWVRVTYMRLVPLETT